MVTHQWTLPINQSNFCSSNSDSKARLSGVTAKSVLNGNIDEAVPDHHWAIRLASQPLVWGNRLWGKDQVKEICLHMFLWGSNWNGWMNRQQEVVPKRQDARGESSCTSDGLDPRGRHTNSSVWSQWTGREWCGKHGVKRNSLFFTKYFVG